MRQDGRGAVCAAHPSFPVIAVGTGAGLGFFDQSLRLLQRLELQVRDLAWHPQSLALAVLEGQQVRIFASDRPSVAFRCHTLTLPWPAAAVCFAPAQLLLGGRELCNWPCRVYGLHVSSAAEGELWPLPEPVSELQLDNSGRFIASLHVGATLRVWWADEEGDAGTGRRRRGSSGSIMDCRSEVIQRDCMAARWAPAKRRGGCPSLLAALGRDGSVTVWRESAFDELPCFVAEARWTDACYTAFGWVVPADGDEEFQDAEDKVPRPTNHGVQASGRMGSTLSLVALGEDQDAVLLKLGTGSRRKVGRLDVLPQTLCSSQGSSCGGVLSVREGSALDLWVCSQSGDLQRWRLGDAKVFVAAAGGAVPLSLILEEL
ncbi:unnamed protein product [Effrenium voratum]|uniref:Uncharacterized protein n=1 Tax=Effrenium voratum TaxID=2562239 RepID=A0AA36MWG1_9DINO|nr:unnamed protein product [Effrenium voratum]